MPVPDIIHQYFDITIWRLNSEIGNPNHERESLIAQIEEEEVEQKDKNGDSILVLVPVGHYLGRRSHFIGIAPVATGLVFRFPDQIKADTFINTVESHDLPIEETDDAPVVVKTKSPEEVKAEKKAAKKAEKRAMAEPKDTDRIDLIHPGGESISVKRKDIDNLLEKGWTMPGEPPKEEPKIFEAKDDDWVVMWSGHSLLRVQRSKVSYCQSVGWQRGWDLYRAKYHELERIKVKVAQEMADLNDAIIILQEKDDE